MEHFVYALIDQNGSRFYIGKTNDPEKRRKRHVYDATNLELNYPVHNKIRKILRAGDNISVEIIEYGLTDGNVDAREQFWIAEHRKNSLKLYNVADGGEGGKGVTPAIIEKVRQKNIGKVLSEETRRKISLSNKGKKFSDQHKKKLSKSRKKRAITLETRHKMSNSAKGKINIKNYIAIDPEGIEHETPNGLTDFCRKHQLSVSNLHNVLTGKRRHHKGWRVRYADN